MAVRAVVCLLSALCLLNAGAAQARVWVLSDTDLPAHRQASKTALARLGGRGQALAESDIGRAKGSDIVLAVGPSATRKAASQGVPGLVGCMLNDRAPLLGYPEGNAVLLDLPPERIAQRLARALPKAKRVSLILERDGMLRAAMISGALREVGILPRLHVVKQNSELGQAFASATEDTDAVLAMSDAALLPDAAMHGLLLAAFRAHVPVIGPAADWVSAGALYAEEWNYAALGRYCADAALDLTRGGPRGQSLGAPLTGTRLTVNRRTARTLGLDPSAPGLGDADRVIE
ncbi:ABC transporter substrate binding protein [Niveibacterium sp. SC-1]|uniref:ABC transporter substrate binding protein n=1 Tax=Niveibacterium sp. SC-1 TaxID=3135646 RepID=UPI00311DAE66